MIAPTTLAADCGGTWHGAPPGRIAGFAIDSRTLAAGEVFVALRTERRDGHDFVAAAAARGAAAAIVARLVPDVALPQLVVADPLTALQAAARAHRARFSGRVIGVTGSAGKTSTKDLLAALLGEPDQILATAGNLNNHLGVPLTLLRLDLARHRFAVVEAGVSGPGEMDIIGEVLAPEIALITTVAPAHLDRLGSLAGVAREKARLAAHRRPGGIAVFPAACMDFDAFRELAPPLLVTVPAGIPGAAAGNPRAHVVPFAVRHQGVITRLCLTWHGSVEEFDLRRVTTGMAGNVALALAIALHLGVPSEALRERLPRWRPAALRGEVRRDRGRTIYLDCYNANPASMADAVEAFAAWAPSGKPRLFVVGCMEELGAESAALHHAAGAHWPWRAGDRMVVLGDQAEAFAAGVRTVTPQADVQVNPDRAEVVRLVRSFEGSVFLKGSRRHALETLLAPAGESSGGPGTSRSPRARVQCGEVAV